MAIEQAKSNVMSFQDVDDLIADYAKTRETVRWPIDAELEAAVKVSYRSQLAVQLAGESAAEINRRYVYLTDTQMKRMLDLVEQHVYPEPLAGIGLELGSGSGLLAVVAAARPQVKAVLALEVCENFDTLIRKVADSVLGKDATKVIPVVGSFDDLKIPDESLDFALDHDSLHHSDDLPRTMKECARVLKPGGFLVCFDRCHPDTVTDEQVKQMLDRVYTKEFLAFNSYPTDITLTRRENGEHEYRMFEWKAATEAAGLELVCYQNFCKEVRFKKAAKGMCALIPGFIRQKFYKTDNPSLIDTGKYIAQTLRKLAPGAPIYAPKKSNVLVMRKPK
jgi:ubiquinone/menaquinone biosynthesis C-methylase UbiE